MWVSSCGWKCGVQGEVKFRAEVERCRSVSALSDVNGRSEEQQGSKMSSRALPFVRSVWEYVAGHDQKGVVIVESTDNDLRSFRANSGLEPR